MCGIVGIFGSGEKASIEAMTRKIGHRGPDGRGVVHLGAATLGTTRLSLLDREHGGQPARSDDGLLALVYNGEIYNHRQLRSSLETRGQVFRGRCDTEVLLRAFVLDGPGCVESLEGMFAFAVTDGKTLWIARDAFGIKPLYYALLNGGRELVFSSELKAMLEHPAVSRKMDRSALLDQCVFGYYLANKTPFAGICEVPPGSLLTCKQEKDRPLRLELHGHSAPAEVEEPATLEAAGNEVLAELRASVQAQCLADHPVGAYLSGGIDSSLLVALMMENRAEPVHTFATAGDPRHPDLGMARALADAMGTIHHERILDARTMLEALPSAVVDLETMGLPSIAEIAAPQVRRHVKAALCGDGADELFAGYAMHGHPGRWLRLFSERYNLLVRSRQVRIDEARDTLAALRELAGPQGETSGGEALQTRFHAFYLRSQLTVAHLRRWDAGTMAHGLELRVPYLTRSLRDLALALPWSFRLHGRSTKLALRAAARRALPASLANAILERPKLAAPSAFERHGKTLERYLARCLPVGWQEDPHPFRPYFVRPLDRFLLDLFVFLFVGHGGSVPEGFRARDLYREHGEALREALETASL